MGFFDFFRRKNSKIEITDEALVSIGTCPNCWGHSEYGEEYIEYVEDRQKDILNKDSTAQKAFVQQFVEDRVTGIRLKKDGNKLVCPRCKTGYKEVSSHIN